MQWKALALVVALVSGALAPLPGAAVDFGDSRPSRDALLLAQWIAATGDAAGKPFAIVDKKGAQLYLFDAGHRIAGRTDVLLGQTVGDDTVEGVGERTQAGQVRRDERTTPAGRFDTVPGRNLSGEDIVWLDYEAAFAIHRVRPGAQQADRLARLRSPTPLDNRASLGCVVVPVAFYLEKVRPVLGAVRGVVYVLPETRSLQAELGRSL